MGTIERSSDDRTSELESGAEEDMTEEEELLEHLKSRRDRVIDNYNEWEANRRRKLAETLAFLPPNVKRRVYALRTLNREYYKLEAKYYEEVHALQCKYEKIYKPLLEKRGKVIAGKYEPTDKECLNPWRDEIEKKLAGAVQCAAITGGIERNAEPKPAELAMDPNVKGIPDFWYTIFKNLEFAEKVHEHDVPILKCLQDIKVQSHDDLTFTLEFHFSPNDYFTNRVLTKQYFKKYELHNVKPLEEIGPQIYLSKGCEINWKEGKNVTVKTIKKIQKDKSGSVRTVTKTVQADSFFNFFSPPTMPDDPNSILASVIKEVLKNDYNDGYYYREVMIPGAVTLYTGECLWNETDSYEEQVSAGSNIDKPDDNKE